MIDALVTGHQHREIAQHVLGVPVIQPGFRGDFVGEIELELDKQKKLPIQKPKFIEQPSQKFRQMWLNLFLISVRKQKNG